MTAYVTSKGEACRAAFQEWLKIVERKIISRSVREATKEQVDAQEN